MKRHTKAIIFDASSNGKLRTLADTITPTAPPTTIQPRNIWVVVDATVDIHLTKRLPELPLHRALALWMAFRGMHPQDALHIMKHECHR